MWKSKQDKDDVAKAERAKGRVEEVELRGTGPPMPVGPHRPD